MEFYKSCFGGELTATRVKDSPAKDFMPAVEQEKIVKAPAQKLEISASDSYGLTELQFAASRFAFI
jgi:hypothetical protein